MNIFKTLLIFGCMLMIIVLQACYNENETSAEPNLDANENLNATLWVQTSAEYDMLCEQTYKTAGWFIDSALSDKNWTAALEQKAEYNDLPPAIIVDVDETILDNSPFQARLIKHKQVYSDELWQNWVNEKNASPIPGAKAFIDAVHNKGIKIFFVTNRILKEPTLQNLQNQVLSDISAEDILCKQEKPDWTSDKSSRRVLIARDYRILMLVGDDYNDFAYLGKVSPKMRKEKAWEQRNYWGKKWFILPNPTYGSFDKAAVDYNYDLSEKEKISLKRDKLILNEQAIDWTNPE